MESPGSHLGKGALLFVRVTAPQPNPCAELPVAGGPIIERGSRNAWKAKPKSPQRCLGPAALPAGVGSETPAL